MSELKVELTCEGCGKPFIVREGGRVRRYCTAPCASRATGGDRRKRETRVCPGCGAEFEVRPSEPKRYCSVPCVPQAGEANGNWKGGLSHTPEGRLLKVLPGGRSMLYSRWLMQQHLDRTLDSDEVVHHVNGDPLDDRIENLRVLSRADHWHLHHAGSLNAC